MEKTINQLLAERGFEVRPSREGCKEILRNGHSLGHFTARRACAELLGRDA